MHSVTGPDRTQQTLFLASDSGWQIASRDADGVQFRKAKQWSKGAVILGCVLLLFWGLGLLVLLLAALDYALAKDKLCYVTAEQLARGIGPSDDKKPAATLRGLAITFLVVVAGFIVLTLIIGLFA